MPNINILLTAIASVAGVITGYLIYREQLKRMQIRDKTPEQKSIDTMVSAYEQTIKLSKQDIEYWKSRAINAEDQLAKTK